MYALISVFSRFYRSHRPCLGNLALNRVINMFIIGALQIGTVYARNYNEFLAVRALFGIGTYPPSGSMNFASSISIQ